MKKKIIFLDGDGTLWYPKKTKRSEKPHWVYHDPLTKDNYLEHLELTPKIEETLEKFIEMGIILVVVSAHPFEEKEAILDIKKRVNHFGLSNFFHSVRSSIGSDSKGKSVVMLDVLKSLGLNKEDALMVGDSYFYDYMAAKDIGIDTLWIENSVSEFPEVLPKDLVKINEVSDILQKLTNHV
jgi:FMN phosphatase YigB (HAD superfamily)